MAKAAYWRAEKGGSIVCELCPHRCRIMEGRSGLCKARRNSGGIMCLPYYGLVSALALDPIEKKPLHHFLPGSAVFSAGFYGCNMRCPFCQNWQISQEGPESPSSSVSPDRFTPEGLIAAALRSGSPSIAYTYSEPSLHFEFVLASMEAARTAGLKNVLVTNGCLEGEPARELLGRCDAVNVDLKTWSAEGYEKRLGGNKEAVLEFIRIASSLCHIEATTLVVPGLSDSAEGIGAITGFLAGLSNEIPLHLSAYHPDWKEDRPPPPVSLLDELARVARKQLRFVYVGNVPGKGADTVCAECGATVIARRGYRVDARGLAISGARGSCAACGSPIHIIV
jgi:pyruvate formate lyase activating enzyme